VKLEREGWEGGKGREGLRGVVARKGESDLGF